MTLYTCLGLIKRFKINPKKRKVLISRKAAFMNGTSARLYSGDKILLKDLFRGLMLPSGNDAAYALAEFFGNLLIKGTLRKFENDLKRN